MRPQYVLALGLVVLATGLPAVLPAQQHDSALEGVWRFVEEVDRRLDGSLIKTGPAAGYNGLLIFTSSGYMSSTIMPKGRTWRRETVTPAELRDTFEGASAHAGRYEPDRAKHEVRMENIMSSILPMRESGTSCDIACSTTRWNSRGHGPSTARSSRSPSGWR